MGKILLFYQYTYIEYPKQIMKWQKKLCESLNLTGRILIGHEGINGTVGGSLEEIEGYKKAMRKHELFKDVDFKEADGGAEHFPKLRVAIRDEIVSLGTKDKAGFIENTGIHLSPAEVNKLIESNKDLVILDTRNTYESKVGTFKNAITPQIENFREFPEYIEQNLETFKDKEVLMFCTGGVRCERATAFLNEKNVAKNVYQINGGIHRYVEEFPNGYFRGKNYVFDGRVAVKINDDVIGHCDVCGVSNDDITNCINVLCNAQYIACPTCMQTLENTCSPACLELVKNNAVDVRTKPKKVESYDGPRQCSF